MASVLHGFFGLLALPAIAFSLSEKRRDISWRTVASALLLQLILALVLLKLLGIMIGGLGVMAPDRRGEIIRLELKSIVAGTLATLMTGTIAGIFC